MKITAFMFAFVLASIASAQSNVSSSKASNDKNILQGVYLGIDYMNLTDLKTSVKELHGNIKFEESEGGISLGTAGIRLGYEKQIATSDFTIAGGARYNESFNKNEESRNKFQIVILEANCHYALNSIFAGYSGLNYSELVGSSDITDAYSGSIGAQVGLIVKATNHLAFNAGYTMLNQEVKYEGASYKTVADVRLSGFTSSLNYIF